MPVSRTNNFERSRIRDRVLQLFLISIAALALVYPTTGWSQEAVMATVNGSDGYAISGSTGSTAGGDKVTTVLKPGDLFIARELSYGEKDWEVYLKSGVTGVIPHNRIRVLPGEPLMKLNYTGSKESWRKLQFKTGTLAEAADSARGRGINYYKILTQASEGDLKAMARFFSLYQYMDGGAAEQYYPETWELLHVVGDDTFAKFLSGQRAKVRDRISGTFSSTGDTEPISKPKPYIKRYFPKSYSILFGR